MRHRKLLCQKTANQKDCFSISDFFIFPKRENDAVVYIAISWITQQLLSFQLNFNCTFLYLECSECEIFNGLLNSSAVNQAFEKKSMISREVRAHCLLTTNWGVSIDRTAQEIVLFLASNK